MKAMLLTAMMGALLVPGNSARADDAAVASATLPAHAALAPGKVMAIVVTGNAQLIDVAGQHQPLAKFQIFTEGNTVSTGPKSEATLAFSNGVVMILKENSQLNITKLLQAPFDEYTGGTFSRVKNDPSQSLTELDLRMGTLICETKQINVAANSSFKVNTHGNASFGAVKAFFALTVGRDAAGNVTRVVGSALLGDLTVTSSSLGSPPKNYTLPGGGQIQFTLSSNIAGPPAVFKVTGAPLPAHEAWLALSGVYWAVTPVRTESPFGRLTVDPAPATPPPDLPAADPLPIDPTASST